MIFTVSPSFRLPFVRQGAAGRIVLAVVALIAASTSARAQPASASPSATPAPASSPDAKSAEKSSGRNILLPPEKSQPVRITRFEKPPVIDGKLDDEVWKQAVVLKDFYDIDPGDNAPPLKPTEVLLGYDAKFLYIAFRCYDEPDKVRATVARRDNIFSDDYVGFFLDTFNDQRKAFEAFFNPLGIQGDATFTEGRGEDFSVDVVMESKGLVD
ncbi:MAG TPA: carbohydrate binding family 9 domain-containing protein, partial [Pyrinomonadaceae bacterium]